MKGMQKRFHKNYYNEVHMCKKTSLLTSWILVILAFCVKAEKNKKSTLSCVQTWSISCMYLIWSIIYEWSSTLVLCLSAVYRYERTKKNFFRSACLQPEDSRIQEVNGSSSIHVFTYNTSDAGILFFLGM